MTAMAAAAAHSVEAGLQFLLLRPVQREPGGKKGERQHSKPAGRWGSRVIDRPVGAFLVLKFSPLRWIDPDARGSPLGSPGGGGPLTC